MAFIPGASTVTPGTVSLLHLTTFAIVGSSDAPIQCASHNALLLWKKQLGRFGMFPASFYACDGLRP
jgi:hypothetical protein